MIRPVAAAVCLNIAAVAIFSAPVVAAEKPGRVLAAELLILRGDIKRLTSQKSLSAPQRRGLNDRVKGSLGLLPWLLRKAGDKAGASKLVAESAQRRALTEQLNRLIARHPLKLATFPTKNVTLEKLNEARAIDQAYCASCHSGAGQGDASEPLPVRDLYLMAREDTPETFLARLVNGIKGDKTLLFTNPLTDAQLLAMWKLYLK